MKKYWTHFISFAFFLWGIQTGAAQNQVTYGMIRNAGDPFLFTAVAYPDFSSANVTISTALLTFYLPAGTATAPVIPVLPAAGSFTNITGTWRIERITPALYQSLGFNPADLQGNEIFQCILQNSPSPVLSNGQPLPLFSFRLPNDCLSDSIRVHPNNNAIRQALLNNLGININNQMSISNNDAPSVNMYAGNNPATAAYACPLLQNSPPVAGDDTAFTFEDVPVTINILANDSDPDNNLNTGSVTIVSGPANGTVMVNPNGSVVYTPNLNFAGGDSFIYEVCDTGDPALCDLATVLVQVEPVSFVCPANIIVNSTPGLCGAVVTWTVPPVPAGTGGTVVQTGGPAPGSFFAAGASTTITYLLLINSVPVDNCSFTIQVNDNQPPVALCKAATVTLDKFGVAGITSGQINNGSSDNCTSSGSLSLVLNKTTFNCTNLGLNSVTLTVSDQYGNSATCTATVTVLEGPGPCTPQFSAHSNCLNNATTLNDGQFGEVIQVKSLAGQTWTLGSNSGLFAPASVAPPAAPLPLNSGTVLTMGSADGLDNDSDGQTDEADEMIFYTLSGKHVESVGYAIGVSNNLGQTGTITNKAHYPNPYFLNLGGPYCLFTPAFTIGVGENGNAQGAVTQIVINGVPGNTFNAQALGIGFHTVTATFDAGTPIYNLTINGQLLGGTAAAAQADPGCQQTISAVVQVIPTPGNLVCNDMVQISLDGDCSTLVTPDMILEGTYGCFDDYSVTISTLNGQLLGSTVTGANIGQILLATVKHLVSGNTCWGHITVEDKLAPILTCTDVHVICAVTNYEPAYLLNTLNIQNAYPAVAENCPPATLSFVDDWFDLDCDAQYSARILRKWTAVDASGNKGTCTQNIYLDRRHVTDVLFPADVTISCNSGGVNTTPAATGAPYLVAFGRNWPVFPNAGNCEMQSAYVDQNLPVCDGTVKILRTWTVYDWCLPTSPTPPTNPSYYIQVIKVVDDQGPTLACPANLTVSTDPFNCCGTPNLPDVVVEDACSRINSAFARVVVRDPETGVVLNTYDIDGSLTSFAGNNLWAPDTLAEYGYTPCLSMGVHTVTYTVADDCGNTSTCSYRLTVEDATPPVSACDEFTQVALGGDGTAYINASTFDDGSYDNCSAVHFKARRMFDNECQDSTFFYDQVKFCCSDINDTILVVFRVYDVEVPDGEVSLNFEDTNANDCMVQVFVEDKIKPICTAPAHTTVTCENFDPSLWAYGFASATDNCCIDTITVTNNLGLFDTVCNKGTITRTFRAIDCGGQSSTCTQRIIVTYEQDYFVKFPNDVIVTVCDGTGNYGEPTFFGEDCELLGVSHEDEVFTVVPDACFKIERTWTIINWCTYNPNLGCIEVPNPNPNATVNHPSNLPGPTVSAAGTPAPWNPTVVAINPGQTPTNYSTFWAANANCYKYKQIIKVIDTQDPVVQCPASPVEVCDLTPNDPLLWNEMYWYDATINSHDLCEAPTDLCITATDLCSGANVSFRYLLFLDLDGDGTMESVVNSINTGIAGLGWNAIPYGNAANPNYAGGTIRQFDGRPVLPNQKYGFALQVTTSGTSKTACLRWNTQQSQNTYVVPELPYGTHKIKWFIEDGCGNETICEYTFVVKDCKKPTVVCINGLSVNIMPTKMIALWDTDFLQYTEDNCTPGTQLKTAIRKSGTGTGFPLNPDGTPQKSVVFTCDELGTQLVELWSVDVAGNADYCETYVIVQDNAGICSGNAGTVAGALKTEAGNGLEDAQVGLSGQTPGIPPAGGTGVNTDENGNYLLAGLPFGSDYTITPAKDNDPLNGVSTFDLVLINKHILGLEPLNTPFKMIAADANNSRSITTFDIVELRKLILGIYTELPNNTSWRFVDEAYQFPNATNPFQEIFPETVQLADLQGDKSNIDFVSVKVGDVNGNAVTSTLLSVEDRTEGTLLFDVTPTVSRREVKAGEQFTLHFRAAEKVAGYQYTLYFPNLELVDVTPGAEMTTGNFGIFAAEHALTTSFNQDQVTGEFSVTFRATTAGEISKMLTVSSRITKAEAYNLNRERQAIALRFNGDNTTITGLGFELYQNAPNPWLSKTQIGFYLPESAAATLTIFDETGRALFTQTGDYGRGYNAVTLDRSMLRTTGVLYYKVETANDSAVKKMIQVK